MLIINIIFFILFENVLNFYLPFGNHSNITLQNFSFGSCFGGFLADSHKSWIFKTINKNNPQMWVWGGDAAYLDSFSLNYFKNSLSLNFSHAVNMFNKTKNDQYYQTLYKNVPTIGVWDDHDYGFNDGNKYYKDKEYIKKLYLDFLDEPEDSLRRATNRGIFTSYTFGDNTTHKTVKIILLDVRFDKNSLVFDKSPDILGEEQWEWLEKELSTDETFTFIVSGTQILPFNRLITESWYGNSRQRLFNLINKTKKNGVILLSGDIHAGQILRTPCVLKETGYYLHEITSSGLTHYCTLFCQIAFDYIFPNDYKLLQTVADYNFGMIIFDWGSSRKESKIITKLIDIKGITRIQYDIRYMDLIYNDKTGNDECSFKLNRRFKTMREYYNYYKNEPIQMVVILFYFCVLLIILFIFWIIYKFLRFIIIIINRISRKAVDFTRLKNFYQKKLE